MSGGPADTLVARLGRGAIEPVTALRSAADVTATHNGRLNAIVTPAGTPLAPGQGPLAGVAFTAKDAVLTACLPTTGGVRWFREGAERFDAPLVAALRAAGATMVGKTNLAEWSGGYDTDNRRFGRTVHPYDDTRAVGGSSGGGAVAVATGMAVVDVSTDLAGSVSVPAHFCGVTGHKFSSATVAPAGFVPAFDSLPGSAVQTRLGVFGPDPFELLAVLGAADIVAPPPFDLEAFRGRRWALLTAPAPFVPVPELQSELHHLRGRLQAVGVTVDIVDLGDHLVDVGICFARVAAYVSGQGTRGLGPVARAAVGERHYDLPDLDFEMRWGRAMHEEDAWAEAARGAELAARLAERTAGYDVLLTPPASVLAPPAPNHAPLMVGSTARPLADLGAWSALNGIGDLASTTVRIGWSGRLPIGVQILAAAGADVDALSAAALVHAIGDASTTGGPRAGGARQPVPSGVGV